MNRREAGRPPPLAIDVIRHNRGPNGENDRFDDELVRRQIAADGIIINPDDLSTMSDLGRGSSGYVTKVQHKPSSLVLARKVIRLEVNQGERNRIMHELQVLRVCNSPYIVGYYGVSYRIGEINIFMEYMNGRSLDSILKRTSRIREEILGKITISVIKGLTYLRDTLNIMHRDIKPSNILVNSSGQVKICDFGVSGQLINSIAQTFVGTKHYMSPERLQGKAYTVQSDIWSLGLTLVELALGVYPIPQQDPMKMYEGEATPDVNRHSVFDLMGTIVNDPPPTIPGPPIFSEAFKEFVDRCLKKLPQERFDLRTIDQHRFVEISEESHVRVDLWVCQVWGVG